MKNVTLFKSICYPILRAKEGILKSGSLLGELSFVSPKTVFVTSKILSKLFTLRCLDSNFDDSSLPGQLEQYQKVICVTKRTELIQKSTLYRHDNNHKKGS